MCEGGDRKKVRQGERRKEEKDPGSLLLRIECDVGGEGSTSCGLWLFGAFTSCSLSSGSLLDQALASLMPSPMKPPSSKSSCAVGSCYHEALLNESHRAAVHII